MCESKQIVCVRFDIVVDTSDIVEATFPGKHLTGISARFSIEILMSVAVITHEILVRFLFDYVGIHVSHNQIRISQVSHE